MLKYLLIVIHLFGLYATAYGTLAGGRLNAFSEGNNAFAGVVNPANAVWIEDRCDVGAFWVHQRSSLNNHDNNPLFLPGKIDLTYKAKNLLTADIAVHKQFKLYTSFKEFDSSVSLAYYTVPSFVKVRTQQPIPIVGTTPIYIRDRTDVISTVLSLKLNTSHSVGITIDFFHLSHCRNGFQNADNPVRSVSPGNVTNNGIDYSNGVGFSFGWRWKISKKLDFGAAWARKSFCGHYRRYQGYEPYHAENFMPQTIGAGFSYRFTDRLAGRLEALWSNLGNLPNANDNVLSDGSLNLNKRGSDKSPGPGLQDATYINIGMGYRINSIASLGAGLSHRLRLPRNSNFISHSYVRQTIYDTLSLGANFNWEKYNLFFGLTYGFKNSVSGFMPAVIGGGRFTGEKQNMSFSTSFGYLY